MKPTPGEPDSPLTHRAPSAEPGIGLLLPCDVLVRESADGAHAVGFMDPVAVMQTTSKPEVAAVAPEVCARLARVRAALA